MKSVNLIFPHQLFLKSQLLENGNETYLIEEYLFFKQYRFHKQKIAFHRASMKAYEQHLQKLEISVKYITSDHQLADIRRFDTEIQHQNITQVYVIDPVDDWLEQRLKKSTQYIELVTYPSPQFLNSKDDLSKFFRAEKKSFFQTSFYKQQRKSYGILLDDQQQPVGGKWTFDTENRKKYPKDKIPPAIQFPSESNHWNEAVDYTASTFSDNPGKISKDRLYPITHE